MFPLLPRASEAAGAALFFFFLNNRPPPEIHPLPQHAALPTPPRRRAGICIVDQTARPPRNVRSSRLSSSNPPGGPSLSGTTWAVKNCALPAGAVGRLRD